LEDLLRPTGQDPADTERLRALVAELRPASRALLFLTAVDGWTSEDAARALGTSPATVRRRRARILAHLRKAMERRERDE
jgi:RNA polymerase sigma factor (sigma-70 family)